MYICAHAFTDSRSHSFVCKIAVQVLIVCVALKAPTATPLCVYPPVSFHISEAHSHNATPASTGPVCAQIIVIGFYAVAREQRATAATTVCPIASALCI